ncbi:MAG: flocculation-associated PEP-CTERM protein PepA [Gammaproteobacteria bacterium]
MNLIKKLGCAAAVALAMVGTANASPVLNGWVFNPNGGGFAAGQQVNEYLDINGTAFIQLAPTSASTFNFTESAVFNSVQADGNGNLFPLNYAGGNITATFVASGSGSFSGGFHFSSGTIKIYQNPVNNQYATTAGTYGADLGNLIATFDVLPGGGGLVDGSGSPVGNGQITVFAKAKAGDVAPGYFFRSNGTDLASENILSFAFTNANAIGAPTATQVKEIACGFAGFTGPGCSGGTYSNVPGNHFFVSNNGQFKLAEVPEPGSLTLLGVAVLGAGFVSRKRKKA